MHSKRDGGDNLNLSTISAFFELGFIRIIAASAAIMILVPVAFGCNDVDSEEHETVSDKPSYIATIPPLAAILREVAGDRGDVACLLQAGSSPHTYEPTPRDMAVIQDATGVFFVHPVLDGWVVDIAGKKSIEVFSFLPAEMQMEMPEHSHSDPGRHRSEGGTGNTDPHFFTSPRAVKTILAGLAGKLSEFDPAGASVYEANAERFSQELDALDRELAEKLAAYAGEAIVLVHPSFLYFLRDYNLKLVGLIEPAPGKEPSPKFIADLVDIIRKNDVKAIFTEPQLQKSAAQVLSSETGLPVYELDPLGGIQGRIKYSDLIRYNADTLVAAFGG
ncbi:zinc ABC transporter substrate-binding protein [bacterium]|nr:zinc ABC transporter substrate-binding protein [bacterium]